MVGRTIAHYRIIEKLGEGGMGVVYRAEDTRLDRQVALKLLPEAFASDAGRMVRFEREAKVLASLNHPHIAAIHGLEDRVLVMELVEGQTLRGPLPLDTALNYARQIGDALGYAHEKGIIHRDLKPANIKITPGGQVKLLDFGLAKMTQPAPVSDDPNSPTLTVSPTGAGAVIGTPGYMAPEQARGQPVDKGADIWAFGCVLYEMLTGRQLFAGETTSDRLAAVLTREPDWDRAPVQVRRLLRQCLERDPQRRLHSIADAWMLLDEAPVASAARSRLPWAAAAVCVILAAVAIWAPRPPRRSLQPLIRLDVDLGSQVELGYEAGAPVIVSPDGTRLVYCSQSRLFTRRLDQAKPVELHGTESAHAPFFSPDGQWVAFFTPGELKKISVQGGTAVTICQAPNAFGGNWGDDGNIVASLAGGGPLSRIPSAGGTPVPATELAPGELAHRWPQVLPGARGVLFTTFASAYSVGDANIEMLASGGRRKTLQRGATWGRYLPSGHLTYVSNGTLFAVPFDLDKLEVRGTPSPVLGDVAYNAGFGSAHVDFSGTASGAGIAVYQSGGGAFGLTTVQWVDSGGQARPLLAKPGDYLTPRLSPDGNRLALTSAGDIWVYDWRRDTMARLTVRGGSNPVWTPDGRYLVFGVRGGMSWARADGAGGVRPLTQSDTLQHPFSLTTDGKRLAFLELDRETGFDIWTLPLESNGTGLHAGKPEPFLQTPFDERHPAFSPDGRWIAYASSESGTFQVYVRAFPASAPGGGGKWQISSSSGVYPAWSRASSELLFRTLDGRIMSAVYTVRGDSFEAGKPRLWSEKRLANLGLVRNYDVTADGKRIAALTPAEGPESQNAQSRVILLLNFFDELRRRVPTSTP